MADQDTQGGLSSADQTTDQTTDNPIVSGLSVAGQKGQTLGAAQSQDVKAELMKIIQQREAEKNNLLGNFAENIARFAGPTSGWAAQQQAFNQTQEGRDKDIMQARLGIANIESAQARQAQQQSTFMSLLNGGNPQPQGTMPADGTVPLTQDQKTQLYALYQQNPQAAITKLIELGKLTDTQRNMLSSGIKPGSPQWNAGMQVSLFGAGAFTPFGQDTGHGTKYTTPLASAMASQPQGAAPATMPQPQGAAPATVPQPQGALPSASGAPAAGALPSPNTQPPSRGSVPPVDLGEIDPNTPEAGRLRVQAVENKMAIARAGAEAEARKLGENYAAQLSEHEAESQKADDMIARAQRMQQDIKTSAGVLGKLSKPGAASAFLDLIDQGVKAGNFGTAQLPGLMDAIVKLDSDAKKPGVMDAYMRLGRDLTQAQLELAKKDLKGEGSVSDNERKLIADVIGDRSRASAASLMLMAKEAELNGRNRKRINELWKDMKGKGYSWSQFVDSPEFTDLRRKQFNATAKMFGRPQMQIPGDEK